jgi:hypothetical protein
MFPTYPNGKPEFSKPTGVIRRLKEGVAGQWVTGNRPMWMEDMAPFLPKSWITSLLKFEQNVTKEARFFPENFWQDIVRTEVNPSRGKGKDIDMTDVAKEYVDFVADILADKDVSEVGEFIQVGRKKLLEAYKHTKINDPQRDAIRALYVGLVSNSKLAPAQEQLYTEWMYSLKAENSDALSSWVKLVNDADYGAAGRDAILDAPGGKSIFVYELNNFAQFLKTPKANLPYSAKAAVVARANEALLPVIGKSSTPEEVNALTEGYADLVGATKDGFSKHIAQRITNSVDVAIPQEVSNVNTYITQVVTSADEEFKALDAYLVNPTFGVGGKGLAVEDTLLGLYSSISSEVAGHRSTNRLIQAGVFDSGERHLLDVVKKTQSVKVKDTYVNYVGNSLLNGQDELHERIGEGVDPKTVFTTYVDRMTDPVVGAGGMCDLTTTFQTQFGKFMEGAKKKTAKIQRNIFNIGYSVIRGALETVDTTQGPKLKALFESMVSNTTEQTYSEMALELCREMTAEEEQAVAEGVESMAIPNFAPEKKAELLKNAQELGIPKGEQDKWVEDQIRRISYEQVYELHNSVLIREFWNKVTKDITSRTHGVGSERNADISDEILKVIDGVRTAMAKQKSGKAHLFYTIGKDVMLQTIKDTDSRKVLKLFGKFTGVSEEKLKDEEALEEGARDYEGEVMIRGVEAIHKKIDAALTGQKGLFAIEPEYSVAVYRVAQEYQKEIEQANALLKSGDKKQTIDAAELKRRAHAEGMKVYMRKYWDKYLANLFDTNIEQGAYTDASRMLKKAHTRFMDQIKDLDFDKFTGPFMQAGIDALFAKINQKKSSGENHRMVLDLFALLTRSPIAVRLEQLETGMGDEPAGAKRVRTIGSLQVEFIRKAIADRTVMGEIVQYIEKATKAGEFKPEDELRLCMILLATNRDVQSKRSGKMPITLIEQDDLNVGKGMTWKNFLSYKHNLVASFENASGALERGDYGPYFEIMAAMRNFSTYTITQMGGMVALGREQKNTRKAGKGNDARDMVISRILAAPELSDQAKHNLIFAATGKMNFQDSMKSPFDKDKETLEIMKRALKFGKRDSLEFLLTFTDDVCQVVDMPGIQSIFSTLAGEVPVEARREVFGQYIASAVDRIRRGTFNITAEEREKLKRFKANEPHAPGKDQSPSAEYTEYQNLLKKEKLTAMAATELMGVAMLLRQIDGEEQAVKDGPHKAFADLMVDILTNPEMEFAQEVKDMASKVNKWVLPYWSIEHQTYFVDTIFQKVRANNQHKWIENGGWNSVMFPLVLVDGDIVASKEEMEAGRFRDARIRSVVVDRTIQIVGGYPYLGGRSSIRHPLKIVLPNLVSPAEWSGSTTHNVNTDKNFLFQAIDIVMAGGDDEGLQARELTKQLSNIAREDLISYAVAQFPPPAPVADFIEDGQRVVDELAATVKRAQDNFNTMVQTAIEDNSIIRVGIDGRVEGVGEKSILHDVVKKIGKERFDALMNEAEYESKKAHAQQVVGEKEKDVFAGSGFDSVAAFVHFVKALTGQPEVSEELIHAYEKVASVKNSSNVMAELLATLGANGGGTSFAKIFGLGTAQAVTKGHADSAANGIASMVQGLTDLNKAAEEKISAILTESGVTLTDKELSALNQLIITSVTGILSNDQRVIGVIGDIMEAKAKAVKDQMGVVDAFEKKVLDEIKGRSETGLTDETEAIKEELKALKQRRLAALKARTEVTAEMERELPKLAQKAAKTQTINANFTAEHLQEFYEWLALVSAGKSTNEEEVIEKKKTVPYIALEYIRTMRSLKGGVMVPIDGNRNTQRALEFNFHEVIPSPEDILREYGLTDDYKAFISTKVS